MTVPQARSHGKTPPSEANSVAAEKRAANASRSRASARRRETILDAALVVAAAGGYEAVQMRTVAERVGIAVGTLYRYFPAKTHLLVAALTREFRRLDSAGDWASGEGTPLERLERLTAHLHDRWQRDPWLTTAMTRAVAVADTRAAAELDRAADEIQNTLIFIRLEAMRGDEFRGDLDIVGDGHGAWLIRAQRGIGFAPSLTHVMRRRDRKMRRKGETPPAFAGQTAQITPRCRNPSRHCRAGGAGW